MKYLFVAETISPIYGLYDWQNNLSGKIGPNLSLEFTSCHQCICFCFCSCSNPAFAFACCREICKTTMFSVQLLPYQQNQTCPPNCLCILSALASPNALRELTWCYKGSLKWKQCYHQQKNFLRLSFAQLDETLQCSIVLYSTLQFYIVLCSTL